MINSLDTKYISFPDKISSVNLKDDNENYLTANNVNDLKDSINSLIDAVKEIDHFLSGSVNVRFNNLSSYIYELDTNPSIKGEMLANDEFLSSKIQEALTLVNTCSTNLSGFYKDLNDHEKRIGKNESDIEHYVSGMTSTVSNFALELSNLKIKISNLDHSSSALLSASNDFEGIINEIKESDIKQNSQIKINVKDIQELKDKLLKFSETLANVNSAQSLNINEILITNSSILYYVEKVEERIGLLDDRMDHLERLIRGLEEPDDWDDWSLLFRLLNILQIKISKLSITNKVPVNVTPMSAVDLAEFQFILREIEYKLKRLPYDQIKETGIDVSSIQSILESLSSMETIDPNKFEFYPLYPAVTEEPTNQ